MSSIALSDRLLVNQPLKFKINGFKKEDREIIDYAVLNYDEGIFNFSSKLNQVHIKKVLYYIKKNYQGYEFCNMSAINCLEFGFSKLNLGAKKQYNKNA